jgi:nitrogen regulatory protein PII
VAATAIPVVGHGRRREHDREHYGAKHVACLLPLVLVEVTQVTIKEKKSTNPNDRPTTNFIPAR